MLTDDELRHRLRDLEAFNVERTESARNTDKLGEAPDVLEENGRELVDQLRALALLHPDAIPTVAGILVLGRDPRNWLPGA